ncbi:hypothetical protein [Paenibacillus beijingensis]|uniref:Bacterial Pleckstrin homology domain-containing protein n=1 Tax=Paenibacillus beijingensis TaxID=1126833 RepID=A0A0D5NN66_9BACL|nr:hypothetical protein [Paenibacillus beijingensis]AJY76701.1 hypothetical protein VN24_21660 [Paenibacillus beijingensis]
MNRDFMPLIGMDGELVISIKKAEYGMTVFTKELVYHKPHVNYYIKLADITSIIPFETRESHKVAIGRGLHGTSEYVNLMRGDPSYSLYVRGALMHNRSGLFTIGNMQFVLPVPERALEVIGKYSGMNVFRT